MNLENIKREGYKLGLEAECVVQLKQSNDYFKDRKYAAAWQSADNAMQLLKELANITAKPNEKIPSNPINDLDDKIERAS